MDDTFWRDDSTQAFYNTRDASAYGLAAAQEAAELAALPLTRGLVLFRTSGSEGRPKWIGLTSEALLASARAVNAFLSVTAADRWLRVLPRFHVGGFGVEARAWVASASCAVVKDKWSPETFHAVCEAEAITLTTLVPTQVFDVVERGLAAPCALRAIVVGGGELRPALWRQARALGWPVLASYGLTEAASQVATQPPDEPDSTRLILLPHWEARVAEEDGTLRLRGPARATCRLWRDAGGHWQREDFPEWLATADRVALEKDGGHTWLRFLGRRDRTVKRLGELVDLTLVERALADAALALGCFGRARLRNEPDPRAGTRLVIECLDAVSGAALLERANAALPTYARASEFRVVADLGLSPLGKPML